MRIVSVNAGGLRRLIGRNGKAFDSGIHKTPLSGPVAVWRDGVAGDAVGNLVAHGGPDNAVYAYSADHYVAWHGEGRISEVGPGLFGENLTVQALHESNVCIGDVYRVGSTLLQVTQPRIPCETLGLRTGDVQFPDRFLGRRRTGMYLRVIEEGAVQAGDAFVRERAGSVTVAEAVEILYGDGGKPGRLAALCAESALSARWCAKVDKLVARRLAAAAAAGSWHTSPRTQRGR